MCTGFSQLSFKGSFPLCTFLLLLHSAPLATGKHLHLEYALHKGNRVFDPGSPRDNSGHSYPVVMFTRTLHSAWGKHSEEDETAKQSQ